MSALLADVLKTDTQLLQLHAARHKPPVACTSSSEQNVIFQVSMDLLVCDCCGQQFSSKALLSHQEQYHSRKLDKIWQFDIVKMIETENRGIAFKKYLNHFNSMNI